MFPAIVFMSAIRYFGTTISLLVFALIVSIFVASVLFCFLFSRRPVMCSFTSSLSAIKSVMEFDDACMTDICANDFTPFLYPTSGNKFLHSCVPDVELIELKALQEATVAKTRPIYLLLRKFDDNSATRAAAVAKTTTETLKIQQHNHNNHNGQKVRDETVNLCTKDSECRPRATVASEAATVPSKRWATACIQNAKPHKLKLKINGEAVANNNEATSMRPYVCEVCCKAFSQYGYLVVHRRAHSGEKPYVCNICHKRFTQSGNLTVHKRTHTAKIKTANVCHKCNKTFLRVSNFTKHLSVHFKFDPPGRQ